MTCPLCKREKLTEWKHSDDICWIARCLSHGNKWLIVLNRHARLPSPEEYEHMTQLADKLFPGKTWRGPVSIQNHFHLHER